VRRRARGLGCCAVAGFKKHRVEAQACAATRPSAGAPAELSPGLCFWGGSNGCRLRIRLAGRLHAARAVAISPYVAWLLGATPPRRRLGPPSGAALAGAAGTQLRTCTPCDVPQCCAPAVVGAQRAPPRCTAAASPLAPARPRLCVSLLRFPRALVEVPRAADPVGAGARAPAAKLCRRAQCARPSPTTSLHEPAGEPALQGSGNKSFRSSVFFDPPRLHMARAGGSVTYALRACPQWCCYRVVVV
jgi:hypothetical protein